ncbi:outer membrane protein assembly factor BamA [Citreimonas sp.]|uniref:outer membrane protein assembly factor BamA n=1 Tax=Citreimonas sp. TaxID=3036715 RepID=UPI004059E19E
MAAVTGAREARFERLHAARLARAARIVASAIVLGAGAASVTPGVALAQSYTFNAVSIEGNERIEPGTILSYAGIARGETVTAAELNDAYQNIVATGLFETVEIVPQGSTLTIRVVEFPTINRITFEGNRRVDNEELSAIVQSQPRRIFSPATAEADAQRIAESYAQRGRLAATVTPRIIRRSENRVDLVFEVLEGGATEIERIAFVGNDAYSDRRLRRVLQTKQAGLLRWIIQSDTFIEDRIAFDRQLLQDFYASRGYVDFRITGVNAELAQERDNYFVTFNVEEGQQFRVGDITVSSDLAEVDPQVFQDGLSLREGAVYSPNRIDNQIARLERVAVREGLNFVRVEPRITRNDRDLTLDVEFLLTRGERIFVERIDIEGNTTTLDRVIRRQFDTVEGDPFNPRAIRQAAERIRALGFFSTAEVNAREGSTPQQVVVDVDVEEQPTGSLSLGGSYSTTDGLGASVSFSERNFLGRGQRLGFTINTASRSQNYAFNFSEPAFLGRDLTFGIALNYRETEGLNSDYDTTRGLFRPFIEFPLSESSRLQLRYELNYSDLTAEDALTDVGEVIQAEAALDERYDSSIGYTYSFDSRRTGLNPDAGFLVEFGQDFGGVGGDTQFVKSSLRATAQRLVWAEEVTLRASFEAGALSYNEGNSRTTDRYLLGPNTMRGFEYGGIGPRDLSNDADDPIGGEYFAVARFEAEFPLGLPEEYGLSAGLFYDVGSVWGLSDETASTPGADIVGEDFFARHVIGFSVFWDSALGPLRLNFSEALVKEDFDEPLNFNLTLSTQF